MGEAETAALREALLTVERLVTAVALHFERDGTPCFCSHDAVYSDGQIEHAPRCRLARTALASDRYNGWSAATEAVREPAVREPEAGIVWDADVTDGVRYGRALREHEGRDAARLASTDKDETP